MHGLTRAAQAGRSSSMKTIALSGGFGLEHLKFEERPVPACGPTQILVRVRAVSLNARDSMMVRGEYNPRQPLPLVPCSDAAGEVVARGHAVTRFSEGDRVCPIFAGLWQSGPLDKTIQRSALGGPLDGTLREYIALEETAAVRAPARLSDVEAACLPCAGVTAYRALIELGQLKPGQTVVCIGTGGVSLFAARIARAVGARVILLSRSADKLARAAALGFELGVNTSEKPDWWKAVRLATDGEGAHHILELGGANTFEQSVRAVRMGGTVSVIGVLSGPKTELDLRPILMQDIRVQGVFVGSRDTFEHFAQLAAESELHPDIDRVFSFAEARAAFEHLAGGKQFGKVVIEIA